MVRAGDSGRRSLRRAAICLAFCGPGLGTAFAAPVPSPTPVPLIRNPRQSARPPQTRTLAEIWRLGGDSDDENQLFGIITDLCVDDQGVVTVVDQQQSRITAFAPDGSFLRRIGREGDGPGEFRRPSRAFVSADGELCVPSSRRGQVQRFSRTGSFLGTIAVPPGREGIVPVLRSVKSAAGHVFALSLIRANTEFVLPGERRVVDAIDALDGGMASLARIWENVYVDDDSTPVWNERSGALDGRWAVGADGRVFVASSFDDYTVSVFLPDGTPDRIISREYAHRRRSAAEKKLFHDWATVNPNGNLPGTRFDIEDFDKDIMTLHARDDGSLWVLSSRGWYDRPPGALGVFDVFDRDGRYDRSVTLLGDGDPARDRYYFAGDRLYVVKCFIAAVATAVADGQENPFSNLCTEAMSVICYRLE